MSITAVRPSTSIPMSTCRPGILSQRAAASYTRLPSLENTARLTSREIKNAMPMARMDRAADKRGQRCRNSPIRAKAMKGRIAIIQAYCTLVSIITCTPLPFQQIEIVQINRFLLPEYC